MKIIELLNQAILDEGMESVSKRLQVPQGLVSQFSSGKKSPGLKSCQLIIDNWGNGNGAVKAPEITPESVLKTVADASIDGEAINLSYKPDESLKPSWEGKDVCLCLPTYGPVQEGFFFSVMALVMQYKNSIRIEHRGTDSMIARSRNQLAKRFLKTGATWSIWLDSDMIFPFGHAGIYATMTGMRGLPEKIAGLHVIERLISHKKTIVGGCYWDRRGSGRLIAGGGGPILVPIPSDNLHAVSFVGTGCLAVHRQVFLDIAQKFPETMHEDGLGNETGFFTPIQTNQRMQGEDESFAWRATQAGHSSYLDLAVVAGHIGTAIHGVPEKGSKV